MINPEHKLSLTKQAAALGISRGSVYYLPKPPSERGQALMNHIDRLHLESPFAGARMLRDLLNGEGFKVGRKQVATLMRKMGIEALYRKPRTTKRHPEHRVYPYLLRNLPITRANQVWAMDITYIPMARGFVYLTVVMDWYSRRVLSHRISITMDTSFCLDALEEAIRKYGKPEIMNTDQGSQFTSLAFARYLKNNDINISMDGKGVWRDNVFVERSNMSTFICMLTIPRAKQDSRSLITSISTIGTGLARNLTAKLRIGSTLTRCPRKRRHNWWLGIHLRMDIYCSKNRGHLWRRCRTTIPRGTTCIWHRKEKIYSVSGMLGIR